MPRLSPEEYSDLEQDIVENGVQVPIMVDPEGTIIDGHHRDEIARKHDLHCPRRVIEGDGLKLRSMAYSLNLHRRHLNREQKRDLISQSLADDPQLSNREHARRTGASTTTVGTVREGMEGEGRLSKLDSRVSGDGRVRPASQPPRPTPEPQPEPAPSFDDDPEPPEWEDVGTIPKNRLNDVAPPRPAPRPAPGFNDGDLDELNNGRPDTAPVPQTPAEKNDVVVPDEYFDRKDHFVQMLQQVRKAEKALKELLFLAQHVDTWDRGSLTDGFRDLLDEIDQTLNSGGMDAALSRLIEGEK